MSLVVIDTDVASAALRGRLPAPVVGALAGRTVAITFVTLGELTKWTVMRDWGPSKVAQLAAWQRQVLVLPFSPEVATTWGAIQARAQRRGRPRPVNDSWIAACCLGDQLPLITFNVKDFEDYATHEGLRLVDGGRPGRP
ncbi:type II toxin-antitoxin system VapC family toxin [Hamadaea tsunoensis]|uniref:type II toxin-antitoxin system VapC family toxin n=1 Tax=Hamadaea tsunoensis TaxID=53368 RepID=UPI000429DE42|nr:type II toxin-antitoxin system VapC family toxin [Hamadaea tsunoensis]